MQPVGQARSANGYVRSQIEKDTVTRSDNKFQTGETNSSWTSFGEGGRFESAPRDRLIYLTSCLVGHQVEVQVKDGSVFRGIFHSTNADDFGVVLKMTDLIKDCSRDSSSKPPSRTLIIPAKDLVQVIAKGVSISKDGLSNELKHEKQLELMTDSNISQSRHVEVGRELEHWVPDETDPECPGLENTFDSPWNRGWDQFEANATLFGVTSTFNEELYTTKLERGPQMRELEREATRIASEIESEETLNLHLAEERGMELIGKLELDEETRFSSVFRGADDSGYDEIEDILLESRNAETFGFVSESVIRDRKSGETTDGTYLPLRSSPMGVVQYSAASGYVCHSDSEDHTRQPMAEPEMVLKHPSVIDSSRFQENQYKGHADNSYNENKEKQKVHDLCEASKSDGLHTLTKESVDKVVLSPNATEFDPSHSLSKNHEKEISSSVQSEGKVPAKVKGMENSFAPPSATSSASDRGGATSTSAGRLSPSSSVGSFSSEKSMLNPHAKEFKFNPNAKSFVPSPTPLRPPSPVAESSLYYSANMNMVTHMHGMPIGIGIGPYTSQQPVMFNPQAAALPQPYYHPNGPQYGQQMMMGQPRQAMYMPTYPQEMQYKGREF